jgi:hypothetical protein
VSRLDLDRPGRSLERPQHTERTPMRLISPTRRAALVAGAVTAAVGAAEAFSALGDSPAAAAGTRAHRPQRQRQRQRQRAAGHPTRRGARPRPIDINRQRLSNVVTVRIDFRPGDTTAWHSHPGPVRVQVVSGAVTLRHAAHGRCLSGASAPDTASSRPRAPSTLPRTANRHRPSSTPPSSSRRRPDPR